LGGQDCVKAIQPTSVKAVRSDGATQDAQANDGLGRRYEFGTLGDVHENVPPAGWRPLFASDQELKTYGFPPRPAGVAALQRWHAHAANYSAQPSEPRLCQTNQHFAVVHNATSRNWAGGMLINNTADQDTFFDAQAERPVLRLVRPPEPRCTSLITPSTSHIH
jgi:hypothetical protein